MKKVKKYIPRNLEAIVRYYKGGPHVNKRDKRASQKPEYWRNEAW